MIGLSSFVIPPWWKYAAIAAMVVGILGYTYWKGGQAPRQELADFQAQTKALSNAISKKMALDRATSDKLIKQKDTDYEQTRSALASSWADWMRQHPGGGPAGQPVPFIAHVCDDNAANGRLSDAVQRYVAAVGRFRARTAVLLEQCSEQSAALTCAQDWAKQEQAIHH